VCNLACLPTHPSPTSLSPTSTTRLALFSFLLLAKLDFFSWKWIKVHLSFVKPSSLPCSLSYQHFFALTSIAALRHLKSSVCFCTGLWTCEEVCYLKEKKGKKKAAK
jgi:hypothetical protein